MRKRYVAAIDQGTPPRGACCSMPMARTVRHRVRSFADRVGMRRSHRRGVARNCKAANRAVERDDARGADHRRMGRRSRIITICEKK